MAPKSDSHAALMRMAINLARRGEGRVEPNPMVGAIVVQDGKIVGAGWHQQFGKEHAEVNALRQAGALAKGATLYVSLEPCCHHGKTPPCTEMIIKSGIRKVVVAMQDPFQQVDGQGITQLRNEGIECEVGVGEEEVRSLIAPYLMLQSGRPWVIAKWAMSLDGKLATRSGDSQWISGELSREQVHQLRGRVDAILVGSRTAQLDNPRLTARPTAPTGPLRRPVRIVFDSQATLPLDSYLATTAKQSPVIVAVGTHASADRCVALQQVGIELVQTDGNSHAQRIRSLLQQLAKRRITNILVEGGGQLLGLLHAEQLIDEVHAFIAPMLIGGSEAPSPLDGLGVADMLQASRLIEVTTTKCDDDFYVQGRIVRKP